MLLPNTEEPDPRQDHRSRSGRRKLLYSGVVALMALLVIELGLQFFYFVREQVHPFDQQALGFPPMQGSPPEFSNRNFPQRSLLNPERRRSPADYSTTIM